MVTLKTVIRRNSITLDTSLNKSERLKVREFSTQKTTKKSKRSELKESIRNTKDKKEVTEGRLDGSGVNPLPSA